MQHHLAQAHGPASSAHAAVAFASAQPALAQSNTTQPNGATMQLTQTWDKVFPQER